MKNYYEEIKVISKVTRAEATIAWFYSGKKQPLIDVVLKVPTWADGIHDCTQDLQLAINNAGFVYLPEGRLMVSSTVIMNGSTKLSG